MDERVSDADREQAVAWLQDHLLAGRLTLEEFSERVDQAYAAVGQGDLDRVRSGLPATEQLPVRGSRRRLTRFTGALVAHVVKRGRLRLGRWTVAGGAFCDVDLDLRQAEIQGRRTGGGGSEIWYGICFGTIDVWRVPAEMPGDYGEITRGLQARHRELPP